MRWLVHYMLVSVTLLQYDHGLIRQVMDVLGVVVKKRIADKHLEDVKEMAIFLDRFMDQMHHAKEERFLFPKAVELGSMKIEDMQRLAADHEEVRQLAKEIIASLRKDDMDAFYRDAEVMVHTMMAHIRREEDNVFPYIEEHMSLDADTYVYKRYEDYILKNFPSNFYEITAAFANRLQDDILGPGYF
jgi:hemerythrin-like domain-containing protein